MITIKAISPDNIAEIRQLIALFDEHSDYCGTAPSDEAYFTNRVLSRFTSLIIMADQKLIGHVAIRWDRRCSTEVQLILPLLIPQAANHINEIGQKLTSLLLRLASRQNWQNLSCLIPLSQIHVQEFLVNYCGAPVYGLCPSYVGSKDPSMPRYTGALFCHQFSKNQTQRTLFVPNRHVGIARYLLESSNHLAVKSADQISSESFAIKAERKAVERLNFPKTGIQYSFVTPSVLTSQKQAINELLNVESPAHFILVDMEDAHCPEVAEKLETEGLSFCGLAPFVRNRFSMIYARCPDHVSVLDSCHAPRAQVLAHYLSSYDLNESLKAVNHTPIVKRSITLEPERSAYDLN